MRVQKLYPHHAIKIVHTINILVCPLKKKFAAKPAFKQQHAKLVHLLFKIFIFSSIFIIKAGDGTRTHDNLIGNQILYQLSYTRKVLPTSLHR